MFYKQKYIVGKILEHSAIRQAPMSMDALPEAVPHASPVMVKALMVLVLCKSCIYTSETCGRTSHM